uniref:Uncharacterized protein n=1 Tax=Cannabis sativa TaxID=3483 RepID=A0A803QRE6_CANSA
FECRSLWGVGSRVDSSGLLRFCNPCVRSRSDLRSVGTIPQCRVMFGSKIQVEGLGEVLGRSWFCFQFLSKYPRVSHDSSVGLGSSPSLESCRSVLATTCLLCALVSDPEVQDAQTTSTCPVLVLAQMSRSVIYQVCVSADPDLESRLRSSSTVEVQKRVQVLVRNKISIHLVQDLDPKLGLCVQPGVQARSSSFWAWSLRSWPCNVLGFSLDSEFSLVLRLGSSLSLEFRICDTPLMGLLQAQPRFRCYGPSLCWSSSPESSFCLGYPSPPTCPVSRIESGCCPFTVLDPVQFRVMIQVQVPRSSPVHFLPVPILGPESADWVPQGLGMDWMQVWSSESGRGSGSKAGSQIQTHSGVWVQRLRSGSKLGLIPKFQLNVSMDWIQYSSPRFSILGSEFEFGVRIRGSSLRVLILGVRSALLQSLHTHPVPTESSKFPQLWLRLGLFGLLGQGLCLVLFFCLASLILVSVLDLDTTHRSDQVLHSNLSLDLEHNMSLGLVLGSGLGHFLGFDLGSGLGLGPVPCPSPSSVLVLLVLNPHTDFCFCPSPRLHPIPTNVFVLFLVYGHSQVLVSSSSLCSDSPTLVHWLPKSLSSFWSSPIIVWIWVLPRVPAQLWSGIPRVGLSSVQVCVLSELRFKFNPNLGLGSGPRSKSVPKLSSQSLESGLWISGPNHSPKISIPASGLGLESRFRSDPYLCPNACLDRVPNLGPCPESGFGSQSCFSGPSSTILFVHINLGPRPRCRFCLVSFVLVLGPKSSPKSRLLITGLHLCSLDRDRSSGVEFSVCGSLSRRFEFGVRVGSSFGVRFSCVGFVGQSALSR